MAPDTGCSPGVCRRAAGLGESHGQATRTHQSPVDLAARGCRGADVHADAGRLWCAGNGRPARCAGVTRSVGVRGWSRRRSLRAPVHRGRGIDSSTTIDVLASGPRKVRVKVVGPEIGRIVEVWDGTRLLEHDQDSVFPYTIYEAPSEHPDELAGIQEFMIGDPTTSPNPLCKHAERLPGARPVLGRTTIRYRCQPRNDSLLGGTILVDQSTGLLLRSGPSAREPGGHLPHASPRTPSPPRRRPAPRSTSSPPSTPPDPSRHTRTAPPFRLDLLDGGTVSSAELDGKPYVLAFFSSDLYFDHGELCPRCVPALLQVQHLSHHGTDPTVLAVQNGERGKPGFPLVPPGLTAAGRERPRHGPAARLRAHPRGRVRVRRLRRSHPGSHRPPGLEQRRSPMRCPHSTEMTAGSSRPSAPHREPSGRRGRGGLRAGPALDSPDAYGGLGIGGSGLGRSWDVTAQDLTSGVPEQLVYTLGPRRSFRQCLLVLRPPERVAGQQQNRPGVGGGGAVPLPSPVGHFASSWTTSVQSSTRASVMGGHVTMTTTYPDWPPRNVAHTRFAESWRAGARRFSGPRSPGIRRRRRRAGSPSPAPGPGNHRVHAYRPRAGRRPPTAR